MSEHNSTDELRMSQRNSKRTRVYSGPTNTNLIENDDNGSDLNRIEKFLYTMNTSTSTKLESIKASTEVTKSEIKKLRKRFDDVDKQLMIVQDLVVKLNELEQRVQRNEGRLSKCEIDLIEQKSITESLNEELERMSKDNTNTKCQLFRNNLLFFNVQEQPRENVYNVLRDFIRDELAFGENAKYLLFEDVHRMGKRKSGKSRPIVAQFHYHAERERVKQSCSNLKGTNYSVSEHYPREIEDVRKSLYPIRSGFRRAGYKTSMIRDKLFVNNELYEDSWDLPFDLEEKTTPQNTLKNGNSVQHNGARPKVNTQPIQNDNHPRTRLQSRQQDNRPSRDQSVGTGKKITAGSSSTGNDQSPKQFGEKVGVQSTKQPTAADNSNKTTVEKATSKTAPKKGRKTKSKAQMKVDKNDDSEIRHTSRQRKEAVLTTPENHLDSSHTPNNTPSLMDWLPSSQPSMMSKQPTTSMDETIINTLIDWQDEDKSNNIPMINEQLANKMYDIRPVLDKLSQRQSEETLKEIAPEKLRVQKSQEKPVHPPATPPSKENLAQIHRKVAAARRSKVPSMFDEIQTLNSPLLTPGQKLSFSDSSDEQ